VFGRLKFRGQGRVGLGQLVNQPLPGGFIGRGSNLLVARRKEFFFLQLDALPWRVAQHAIKAALGSHFRKFQRPVEEALRLAQLLHLLQQPSLELATRTQAA
jgi:hypothetical protein